MNHVHVDPEADEKKVLELLKIKIEKAKLLKKIPKDIFDLLAIKAPDKNKE